MGAFLKSAQVLSGSAAFPASCDGKQKGNIPTRVDRGNLVAHVKCLHRLVHTMPRKRRASTAAAVHESQWGFKCPTATPDDENCGYVTELAVLAYIAPDISMTERDRIIRAVTSHPLVMTNDDYEQKWSPSQVFSITLYGAEMWFTTKPAQLVSDLQRMRQTGRISQHTSIVLDQRMHNVCVQTIPGKAF